MAQPAHPFARCGTWNLVTVKPQYPRTNMFVRDMAPGTGTDRCQSSALGPECSAKPLVSY